MPHLIDNLLNAFGAESASAKALRAYSLTSFIAPTKAELRRLRLSHAILRGALREISERFQGVIPFILLKGEPLEELLFDKEYARSTGDLDLLILPGDLELARHLITTLGYRRMGDAAPLMWTHNQEAWRHQTMGAVVELHWSLAEPGVAQPAPFELFSTQVTHRFEDGLEMPYLRWDWLFFHLVLHFHHHMGFAKGLLDIAGWCERFGARLGSEGEAELLRRARYLGLYGALQWPLHIIENLTGTRPPLWDDGVDWATQAWAWASAAAMRDCLIRTPHSPLEATLVSVMPQVGPQLAVPMLALRMLVADGAGAKIKGFGRPLWGGPHRLGRALAGWLQ